MCLKLPIPIVEHLITGWGKERGSETKAMEEILAVGFMLIYHLSYNSNLLWWYTAGPTHLRWCEPLCYCYAGRAMVFSLLWQP